MVNNILIHDTYSYTKHLRVQKGSKVSLWSRGLKLEINIPPQHISAKNKRGGGLIIEGA